MMIHKISMGINCTHRMIMEENMLTIKDPRQNLLLWSSCDIYTRKITYIMIDLYSNVI